ncbi:MAG TPA: hypothetical protein PKX78_02740 [Candidatus Woesebacteria bacterium]|nr:hypothetical protein [Candidatus Woesebacteria bacterium]
MKIIRFFTFILLIYFLIGGITKFRVEKDIAKAKRIAQLFGMNERNYLASNHSSGGQMYDNIEILFSTTYPLETIAKKVDNSGFEKILFFDTMVDNNFYPKQPGTVESNLWIKFVGQKVEPNNTIWVIREKNGKTFNLDYMEINDYLGEWVYDGKEVGNKLIKVTLSRYD